jgi:hypothetical protein
MVSDKLQTGIEVVQEILQLLQGLQFSVVEGTTVAGDHVRIVLAPRRNGDDGYQLMLTCFAFGDRKVDWDNFPVRLSTVSNADTPAFIFRINTRGQALIDGVPAGEYQLSLMPTYFGGSQAPDFVPDHNPEALAAFGIEAGLDRPKSGLTRTSNDARLVATPEIDASGRTRITFESNDGELRGGKVRFALVDNNGKVVFAEELALKKDEKNGFWGAHWEGNVKLRAAVHLVFDYLPAASAIDA